MYAHGYGGSRNEISLHMGRHNAMGYAMCSLDSYGHGLTRWREDPVAGAAIRLVAGMSLIAMALQNSTGLLTNGRDRDLNNDGLADPGADMWTSDVFHTRDMVRQSVVEYMQFVRMLRSMDGRTLTFTVMSWVMLIWMVKSILVVLKIPLVCGESRWAVSSLVSSLGQNPVLMLFHQMQVVQDWLISVFEQDKQVFPMLLSCRCSVN